ncbi:MAG: hypothetical protein GTO22_06720 [Gemmatimonadales bacterium]|nr:hypothetical protein [Gemmatimonadales bacterium]
MAVKGSRGAKKHEHDPRCSWEASGGRCWAGAVSFRVGAVKGFCPWHEHVSGAGGPRGTYEEFSAFRKLELGRDRRWALYSSRDWWRLLNGEWVAPPSCDCGRSICSNADVLVPEGIAPPPAEAENEAGEVVCVRCGPVHPTNAEARLRRLSEKKEKFDARGLGDEGQRIPGLGVISNPPRGRGHVPALAAGPAVRRSEAPVEDPGDGLAGE